MKRRGARKNQIGKRTCDATTGRANCRAALPTTTVPSLGWRLNTMKFAATSTNRGHGSDAKARRLHLHLTESVSSAAESQRGGAKTGAAKSEMAKAGTVHYGRRAAQTRNRRPSVMHEQAAVETGQLPTSREARTAWNRHLSQTLMSTELRRTQTDLAWQGQCSSVTKRFLIHAVVHRVGTRGTSGNSMNQARRNSAEQLAGHRWTAPRNARNVPASAERRRRPAKPPHTESATATREPRYLQVRPSRRMEILAEAHCHSGEGTDLKPARRRGERIRLERLSAARSDLAESRSGIDRGIAGSIAQSAIRFRTRSIHQGSRETLCGGWRCD
jgi:hypothetical protein